MKITRLLVEQINREPEEQGHRARDPRRRRATGCCARRSATARTARGPCAAPSSATSRTRSPRRSSAATMPGSADRDRRAGRRALVLAGRTRGSAVGMIREIPLVPACSSARGLCSLVAPARCAGAQEAAVERVEIRGQPVPAERDPPLLRHHQARATATTSSSCATTSGGCGTPAFWTTSASTRSTAPRGGKIVTFIVQERPQGPDRRLPRQQGAQQVDHRGRAEEAGGRDPRRQLLRPSRKARRVEEIIKEMLMEKGRPFGTVKTQASVLVGRRRTAGVVRHRGRRQGQGQADRLRRQQGVLRRRPARRDEEDQASGASGTSAGSAARTPSPRRSGPARKATTAACRTTS